MSTAVARYTPEDLLAMPDGKSFELVGGRLVERKTGAESSRIGTRLSSRLDLFCDEDDLGIVWGVDNGFQCFPQVPSLVRRPDVSLIRRGRLPGDIAPKGWVKIPPDLAVEVVSPNDIVEELEEKLDDYRKAGVPPGLGDLSRIARGEGPPSRQAARRVVGGRRTLRRGYHPRLLLRPA